MAFWDNLGLKASETTAKAVQKAKDLSDVAKLNAMISEEETKINNTYYQIGKLYFALHASNPEDDFISFIHTIIDANQKAESYKQQIMDIRGVQRCPKCGAEIQAGVAFCSACGAQLPREKAPVSEETIKCSNCGAIVKKGVRFCTSCGKPMEYSAAATAPAPEPAPAPSPVPVLTPETAAAEVPETAEVPGAAQASEAAAAVDPSEKVCPICGAKLSADLNFCTNCGAKL